MEGMGVKEKASLSHPSLQEGLNPSCSSSCWPGGHDAKENLPIPALQLWVS